MVLHSSDIYLRPVELSDANTMLDLRVRNRAFLKPWEPIQQAEYFTLTGQRESIEKSIANWELGTAYGFGIFLVDGDVLIGRVNLSNVVRGAWESCTIGYFLDQRLKSCEYMTEAVRLTVDFAFGEANLHRVQAAVIPRNAGSIRVLEKVGFQYEGFAEYYLKINGIWEHHNIYNVTREYWPNERRPLVHEKNQQ